MRTLATINPHIVRGSNPFGCFQGLGGDKYLVPPIDIETGQPTYPIKQWRTFDKKIRKGLTKEQDQINLHRTTYLKQVKREEKKQKSILGKQLQQLERVTAIEAIQSGATQSMFGGNLMSLLPFAGAGILLLVILKRKKKR